MTILQFSSAFSISDRLVAVEQLRRCDWPACGAACCVHGVWLDLMEMDDLRQHAAGITVHMSAERRDPALWFTQEHEAEPAMPSREVVAARTVANPRHAGGTECVFLREDLRCALQVAGEAAGEDPWRFKPFYCLLHPLTLDEAGRVTLAPSSELLLEPAGCMRASLLGRPLRESFGPELKFLRKWG
jgi:Fe-S-cluster containining protein